MPFSHFNQKDQWLEMRDSRLGDLIDYCEKFLPDFLHSCGEREQVGWLSDAVREWKEVCELPPGCKTIRFDAWLSSPQRREQLEQFFGFVARKIRETMPATEAVIATEAERVQSFIRNPGEAKRPAGVPPNGE